MTFQESIRTCLNKYIDVEGRAARSEYWWFQLFLLIVNAVTMFLDYTLGVGLLNLLATLAFLAPNITVGVRRLHDKDRSGWWLLIVLVPIIGILLLLYWFVTRGTPGSNRFGPDPL